MFDRFFPEQLSGDKIDPFERLQRTDVNAVQRQADRDPFYIRRLPGIRMQAFEWNSFYKPKAVIHIENEETMSAITQVIADAGNGDEKKAAGHWLIARNPVRQGSATGNQTGNEEHKNYLLHIIRLFRTMSELEDGVNMMGFMKQKKLGPFRNGKPAELCVMARHRQLFFGKRQDHVRQHYPVSLYPLQELIGIFSKPVPEVGIFRRHIPSEMRLGSGNNYIYSFNKKQLVQSKMSDIIVNAPFIRNRFTVQFLVVQCQDGAPDRFVLELKPAGGGRFDNYRCCLDERLKLYQKRLIPIVTRFLTTPVHRWG